MQTYIERLSPPGHGDYMRAPDHPSIHQSIYQTEVVNVRSIIEIRERILNGSNRVYIWRVRVNKIYVNDL